MKIIHLDKIDIAKYGKKSSGSFFVAHVRVDNLKETSESILVAINDKSWIQRLNYAKKETFESCMEATVRKIAQEIFNRKQGALTESFGEYIISFTALDTLEEGFGHNKVPLAELLRDQESGNPGFDFHSESTSKIIVFGEAKYSEKSTAHGRGIKQVKEFIGSKKDSRDLNMLEGIVSDEAIESHRNKRKGFAVAFSYHSQDIEKTLKNIFKSEHIEALLNHEEVYLIAIEIQHEH